MIVLVDALVILLLAGLVALALGPALSLPGPTPTLPWLAAPVAAWLALVTPMLVRTDLAEHRLPDGATLPALGLALGGALLAGFGGGDWLPTSAIGIALAAGKVAWSRGALGLGDVKLGGAAAGGAQLVAPDGATTALAVCGLAGVAALLVGAVRRRARRLPGAPAARARPSPDIAYGPCLLTGYWAAVAAAAAAAGAAGTVGVAAGAVP